MWLYSIPGVIVAIETTLFIDQAKQKAIIITDGGIPNTMWFGAN